MRKPLSGSRYTRLLHQRVEYVFMVPSSAVLRFCVWGTQSVVEGISELSEALGANKTTEGNSFRVGDDWTVHNATS